MGSREGFYLGILYREHYQWNNILFKLSGTGSKILFREPEIQILFVGFFIINRFLFRLRQIE